MRRGIRDFHMWARICTDKGIFWPGQAGQARLDQARN